MNKLFITTLAVVVLSSTLSLAAPVTQLPLDTADCYQIGTGQLTTNWPGSTFYSYDVTDTTLSVLVVKLEVTAVYALGEQPGFGSIQVFNGTQQLYIDWVAAGVREWSNTQFANTWYEPIGDDSVYAITRPAKNGNAGSAGDVNDNYTYPANGVGSVNYYYVAFDNPVTVTDIKMSSGSNCNLDFDLTFYSLEAPTNGSAIPEPTSIALLCSALASGFFRYVRARG